MSLIGKAQSYNPKVYPAMYMPSSNPIIIDGNLSDNAWQEVPWTDMFIDIEGTEKPQPYQDTRVKMAWDESYFYIAAELMEAHIWATYDQRDMVIFHENDFEVFIDPNGDTHNYLELEINALGTIWDLLLNKPYMLKGTAINSYDIKGLKTAVKVYGSINDASDIDEKWTIEIAIPWSSINEISNQKGPPQNGDYWKVNFSRVHWDIDIVNGEYVKQKDATTQKIKPENNWVWSPQGLINMHKPEYWGVVVFLHSPNESLVLKALEKDKIKWKLREVFNFQKEYYKNNEKYSDNLSRDLEDTNIDLCVLGSTFIVKYCVENHCYYIREDGRVWESNWKK